VIGPSKRLLLNQSTHSKVANSGAGRGKPVAKQKPSFFNTSTAYITRAEGIQPWEAKALWLSNAKQPKSAIRAALIRDKSNYASLDQPARAA
jgi:hypothetical protein